MRKLEKEPHSGSAMLWLMAVLVIVLSTKVDDGASHRPSQPWRQLTSPTDSPPGCPFNRSARLMY